MGDSFSILICENNLLHNQTPLSHIHETEKGSDLWRVLDILFFSLFFGFRYFFYL
jgi:hypothetical protein